MNTKYIFVTGGVVSGLGKGITAASLGRLLKNRGYKVTIQKFDPYINVDPGTMNGEIKSRNTFEEEDWLVIIASDHGGHLTRHGTQKIQDRTTFLALSKPIEDFSK